MSRTYTQINANTDIWQVWFDRTNTMLDAFSETVTLKANTSGDTSSGNGFISGTFGSTTLVGSNLRGGNVLTPGDLTITSNAIFTGAQINATSNVYLQATSLLFNTNSSISAISITSNGTSTNTIVGGTNLRVTANTLFNGDVTVSGNIVAESIVGNVVINGSVTYNDDLIVNGDFQSTNILFEATGNNRISYDGSNNLLLFSNSFTFSGNTIFSDDLIFSGNVVLSNNKTFDLQNSTYFKANNSAFVFNFDSNDYLNYNKTSNIFEVYIDGSSKILSNTTAVSFSVPAVFSNTIVSNGNITVNGGTDAYLILDANASGNIAQVIFQTNGSNRWGLYKGGAAEAGANAGSNFLIGRYGDAGTYIDNPLSISRATGLISVSNGMNITGNANVSANVVVSGTLTFNSIIAGNNASGNRYVSTSTPSGGSNGDIWYRY